MNAQTIKNEAKRVKAKYGSADPFEICEERHIQIIYQPMGTSPGACKGFYLLNCRCKAIVLNSEMPEDVQRIILAHELGHDILHSSVAGINAFHEFSVCDNTDRLEYEANIFAAEFTLEDEVVLDAFRETNDFFRAACCLNVPPELLDFKTRLMNRDGYQLESPITANGDFLKRDITQRM